MGNFFGYQRRQKLEEEENFYVPSPNLSAAEEQDPANTSVEINNSTKGKKIKFWKKWFNRKVQQTTVQENKAQETAAPPAATKKSHESIKECMERKSTTPDATEGTKKTEHLDKKTSEKEDTISEKKKNQEHTNYKIIIDSLSSGAPMPAQVSPAGPSEILQRETLSLLDSPPQSVSLPSRVEFIGGELICFSDETKSEDREAPVTKTPVLESEGGEIEFKEASQSPKIIEDPVGEEAEKKEGDEQTNSWMNINPLPPNIKPAGQGGSFQSGTVSPPDSPQSVTEPISNEELVRLGLPNLAQTCYMNSTLQGLRSLVPFMDELYKQEHVWSAHPKAQLYRVFSQVDLCRFMDKEDEKREILATFKSLVAEQNSEFQDDAQKDAHEFLSCVLEQMRSPALDLQAEAMRMGMKYTCPVETNIVFQMQSKRTCRGCGIQSMREEDFINLSLDLSQEYSVSGCLSTYLKDTSIDFHCECGSEESAQRWSFKSLPKILILQLQRFRFTESYSLEKVERSVVISQNLLVSPKSCVNQESVASYSLVGMVSHLGSGAEHGHYICDAAYRREGPANKRASWVTCNDSVVSETTRQAVSRKRRKTAFLLFYERDSR